MRQCSLSGRLVRKIAPDLLVEIFFGRTGASDDCVVIGPG